MMGRLRSTTHRLGATAALICALSLAGLGTSRAASPNVSGSGGVGGQPCNDVCKAYMAWSDRVAAMLHPSPTAGEAVPDAKPAGQVVHRRLSKPRQPSLNAFAQFPARRDARAQSAEAARAMGAPSLPVEEIADRFPTTAGFVTAILASTPSARSDAPESTVASAADAIPAMRATSPIDDSAGGMDVQFALSVFLTLCLLSALVVWGWGRARTPSSMR